MDDLKLTYELRNAKDGAIYSGPNALGDDAPAVLKTGKYFIVGTKQNVLDSARGDVEADCTWVCHAQAAASRFNRLAEKVIHQAVEIVFSV